MLEPDFLTTVTATLRHPTTLAAIASVGMHAALGLVLPAFPVGPASQAGFPLGNVELVELSPSALRRLPPLEVPQLDDFATPDDFAALDESFADLLPPEPGLGLADDALPDDLVNLPPSIPGDPSLYSYSLDPSASLLPFVPLPPAPGRAAAPPPRPT
ncbi:MAG: hypothetical protein HC910_20570, partial [Spirulinaceae cyanobacterium SM2_1_0]|nr:hypothetical protein [Spirulinaceae cyanobacterium SM2_1_0]